MRHSNLKAEMARNGVTVGAIAELLGVRFGTISDKINGRTNFYFHEARKIRDHFFPDLTLEYLFAVDHAAEHEIMFRADVKDEAAEMVR